MGKSIYFPALVLFSLVFFSCKKTEQISLKQSSSDISRKIESWLMSQKNPNYDTRNNTIDHLKANLDLNNIEIGQINDEEELIVVSLSDNFKTINNKNNTHSSYLLLTLGPDKNIVKGNIVQYVPEAGFSQLTIPKKTFIDFYNSKQINYNGRFVFLTLTDRFLSDYTYKSGERTSQRVMTSKIDSNARTTTCIDWYLVTTIHYDDGTFYTYSEYITTTCNGVCAPATEIAAEGNTCDPYPNGGGNNQVEYEYEVVRQDMWKVYIWPGSEAVYSTERFKGKRTNYEVRGGHFTDVKHLYDQCNKADGVWWSTFTEMSYSVQVASAKIRGKHRSDAGIVTNIENTKYWWFDELF